MSTTTDRLDLPGQAHATGGPIDHTGMYVMHFAFRRDLDDLVAAAEATPVDDTATWDALASYWRSFAELLHHHHTAEDAHYWPALADSVDRRGTIADQATVVAMQEEHAGIDPLLRRCHRGVGEVSARAAGSNVAALCDDLAELRSVIGEHMAHEERAALPLVSRVMSPEEYALVERAIGRSYPVRTAPRMVAWAMHGLPPTTAQQVLAAAGAPQRILLRLGRGRFERRHRRAFRYVES
jgi:hemerythrin-like domain-containing protein